MSKLYTPEILEIFATKRFPFPKKSGLQTPPTRDMLPISNSSGLSIPKLVGRVEGRNPSEATRASDVDMDMIPYIVRNVQINDRSACDFCPNQRQMRV